MKRGLIIALSILLLSIFYTELCGQYYSNNNKSTLNNGQSFEKRFDVSNIKELKLSNKHGYIDISSWEEDEIVIEVVVKIETASHNESEKILGFISFKDRIYSHTLDFKTVFSEDFFSNYPFTINYNVKVPKHIGLNINNSIGDVRVLHIDGEVKLTHSYGNLKFKNIACDKTHVLNLSFVEGVIDSIGSIKANFSNCTLNMTNGHSLKGETNYCMASIINFRSIDINSFTDRLTISHSDSLILKGTQFIGKVEHLNLYGFCELEKGQLLIDASETIKELTISNDKVKTTVVIPHSLSYLINGEVFNGTLTHPSPQLLRLFKEDNNVTFSGKIGNATEEHANLILFNKDSSITIKN